MQRLAVLIAVTASMLAAPLLAGPPAKRPDCQVTKAPVRELKRLEPCRKPTIPPVIDPTPVYLISTAGLQPSFSDLT